MHRIYEDWAYSDAAVQDCLWRRDVAPNPPLQDTATTEVAIIGGGFTGLSAALHLAQAGIGATVLEAKHVGWGASGRNGGFCCLGSSMVSNGELQRKYGPDGRQSLRDAEKAAIALVGDLLDDHGIAADRHSEGETILAHRPRHMAALRHELPNITQDYAITPILHDATDLTALGISGPFHGGMTIPLGFALNPGKYVHGLADAAKDAGAILHDSSPVTAITRNGGFTLTTPGGQLHAKKLILATNGYSSEDIPNWLRARYLPLQSNIIATRPLTQTELAAQGWTSRQMAYDTRSLLHYFRLLPDNRFLFGMRGGVYATPRSNARLRARIHHDFETMFPAWAAVERPHFWSGLVCLARNRTPFVGPIPDMPGAFASLAYHGNGLAMGTYGGRLLADLVQGKRPDTPYPTAFAAPPKRFPLRHRRRALIAALAAGLSLIDG